MNDNKYGGTGYPGFCGGVNETRRRAQKIDAGKLSVWAPKPKKGVRKRVRRKPAVKQQQVAGSMPVPLVIDAPIPKPARKTATKKVASVEGGKIRKVANMLARAAGFKP